MNVYEAMRAIRNACPKRNNNSDLWAALDAIDNAAKSYDALAPDWDTAPDDAMGYTIDCDGETAWHDTEPIQHLSLWGSENRESIGYIELPIGIDWRLCKWIRPANEPETMHYAIYGPMD